MPEDIKVENLSKGFPGVQALDKVDMKIQEGEARALVGENGAGKSTLIKLLTGVYEKDEGRITIKGEEIDVPDPSQIRELGVSCIYQHSQFVPYFTVAQTLFINNEPTNSWGMIDFDQMNERARGVLQEKLNLDWDPTRLVQDLSTAEKQLLQISKALIRGASILILDEPTSSLAENEVKMLFSTIEQLKAKGVTIIYISHRLEEVFEIADTVTVLRNGKKIATSQVGEISEDELIEQMVGEETKERYPKEYFDRGKVLMEAKDLAKQGTLEWSDFVLHEKEILGVYGKVGAGKTELARLLFGLDHHDEGEITLKGKKLEIDSPQSAKKSGIALIPEKKREQGIVEGMSVRENISLATLDKHNRAGLVDSSEEKDVATKQVDALEIATPGIETLVNTLSGGNQQKISLAKWLAAESKVLIFDQPTVGIDVKAKVEIYKLIEELARQGAGVIIMTSELPEAMEIPDRLIVMRDKKQVAVLDPSEVSEEEVLHYAIGGGTNDSI